MFVWGRPLRACCPVLFRQRSSRPVRHGVTHTQSSLPIKRCVLRPAAPPPPPFVGLHCYWSPQPAARRVIFFLRGPSVVGGKPPHLGAASPLAASALRRGGEPSCPLVSPPGPRLPRPWSARGMPPRCGSGPARFAPSCFCFRRCLFPFARRPARAWPASVRPVGCRPDAVLARLRSFLLFCPSLKTIN